MEKQKLENEIPQQQSAPVVWCVEQTPIRTTHCCFCIPLKTACFTLGYLSLMSNVFNTLSIAGTLTFLGIASHGFSYFRTKEVEGVQVPDYDEEDQTLIVGVATGMGVVFLLNLLWLLVNIYLLVGLHMRKPGYIKVHVGIATIRLFVMIFGIAIVQQTLSVDSIITLCLELGLTAYFTIIYYMYAVQLELENKRQVLRNQAQNPEAPGIPTLTVTDHYIYPKYLDKQHLVEKEKY